jgi:hypothetical protein
MRKCPWCGLWLTLDQYNNEECPHCEFEELEYLELEQEEEETLKGE